MPGENEQLEPREREALIMEAEKEFSGKYSKLAEDFVAEGIGTDKTELKSYLTTVDPELIEGMRSNPEFQGVLIQTFVKLGSATTTEKGLGIYQKLEDSYLLEQEKYKALLGQGDVFNKDIIASIRAVLLAAEQLEGSDGKAILNSKLAACVADHLMTIRIRPSDELISLLNEEDRDEMTQDLVMRGAFQTLDKNQVNKLLSEVNLSPITEEELLKSNQSILPRKAQLEFISDVTSIKALSEKILGAKK